MIDVFPGINEKTTEEIAKKLTLLPSSVSVVHIDISDNTLVPSEACIDVDRLKTVLEQYPDRFFEAHLMVANPEKFIRVLVDAGFRRLIAHIECSDVRRFLEEATFESVEVGVAIDGPTDLEEVEPYLDEVDVVLVMTIEAGPSGQPFLPETLEKVKVIHQNLPDLAIAVDGGITPDTGRLAKEVGASRLVSTTFLFQSPSGIQDRIRQLQ